jgi:short-subunit dehydrogenase
MVSRAKALAEAKKDEKEIENEPEFSAPRGQFTIVNVSSQASLIAIPDHTAYCVSKGMI